MEAEASQRSVFGYRAYTLFFVGRIVSVLSVQMLVVAVGWQVYTLTGSALDLGLLGVAQFVPMLALTLVVGHVADRYDHRAILLACQAAEASAAAVLAVGSAMGSIDTLTIYAIMALLGAARAFELPTMVSMIPNLVPRALVPSAIAWFASTTQAGQILGPPLGGLFYGFGPTAVYGLAMLLWCIGIAFFFIMRRVGAARTREPVSIASLLAGIWFVWRDRVLLATLSLDLFAVLISAAPALFPIFARDVLGTGPWGLGLLRSAPGVGAFAMSVVLARWPLRLPIGKVMFAVLAVFGTATIVFALSESLLVSLAALVVLGAADAVSVVIRFALVQLRTPAEMRGRVSAVNSMFTSTSNYLGEFRAGVVAALFGAVPAAAAGGVGVLVVAMVWLVLFPELIRIRSMDQGLEQVAATAAADKAKP